MPVGVLMRRLLVGVLLLGVLGSAYMGLFAAGPAKATRTTTKNAKWYSIANDRFRRYDVGGQKTSKTLYFPIAPFKVTVPWHAEPLTEAEHKVPGYPPYEKKYPVIWDLFVRFNIQAANYHYAQYIDWPVTMIWRNDASLSRVYHGLEEKGLNNGGSRQFLTLSDSPTAGEGGHLWDEDGGLKESKCAGVGADSTNHVRLYADTKGQGWVNQNEKMYNPYWGFYVLGTTHVDYLECPHSDSTSFGKSEAAQDEVTRLSKLQWEKWNLNSEGHVYHGAINLENKDPKHRFGEHTLYSDGRTSVIKVGNMPPKASASINGGEEPESPAEPDPELEPAIRGDVDGDDKADLVGLKTSKTAYTFKGSDGSSKTSFAETMDSSLFDGTGHHVIDVADVDADGYSDLVTLVHSNVVYVYPGKEDGSFGSGVLARGGMVPGTFGSSGHEPIGVGDVTGDKRADLVTFYAPQGNFYVYPGLAGRQFGDGKTLGGGQVNSALFDRQGVYFTDVADVSGDGRADVVGISSSVGSSYGAALTYKGTSTGLSQTPTQVSPQVDPILNDGAGHEPIGLGDVNGDKKADLVTLNTSGQAAVFKGTYTLDSGTQTYRMLESTPVISLSSLNSSLMDATGDDFVGLIDKTGDGKADLIKVTAAGGVEVAAGQSSGQFATFAGWVSGVSSNRGDVSPAYELVQEKPFIRRIGCTAVGCSGRPQPTEHDVDGDRQSDLVTLDATGTSHTFRSVDGHSESTSFAGTMDPAIYDHKGHYVIDVADVTGDRKADKVTLASGTVYVYPGKGNGSFGASVSSFAGTMTPGPSDSAGYEPIAVADVTGDAKADLITFLPGTGIRLYPANSGGTGTFGTAVVSQASLDSALHDGSGSYFLDVTDVNFDRLADLVTATTTGTVRVYSGATNGQFTALTSSTLDWAIADGQGYEPMGVGDVNGDRASDLVALSSTGTVQVFEGKTTGIFATGSPSGSSPQGLIDSNLLDRKGDEIAGLLDENGDRRADLVTIRSDGSARVYRGQENFKVKSTPDVNLLPDFVPGRRSFAYGHELVGEKPFLVRPGCYAMGCRWPPFLAESDVDGDRRGDLVTLKTDNTVYVYPGNGSQISSGGTASFSGAMSSALYDGTGHYPIDAADVSGDGRADLITLTGSGWIRVHPGKSDKTFEAGITSSFQLPPVMNNAGTNEPIAVADLNGDRLGDLISYTRVSGTGQLAFYPGRADGTFGGTGEGAKLSLSGINDALRDASGEYFLDAIDVTGDRLADVVSIDTSGSLKLYRGKVGGSFAAAITAATINPVLDNGAGQEPIGLGDVNRDGMADLLTLEASGPAYQGKLKLWVAKSDGSGTFVTPTGDAYSSTVDSTLMDGGIGDQFVGLLDYHGDRRADLVAGYNLSGGSIHSYPAQSDGATFGFPWSAGSFSTNRFHGSPGWQFATERPLIRRIGCTTSGCTWSAGSTSVPSDVDGDRLSDLVTVDDDGTAHVYESDGSEFQTANGTASLTGRLDPALFDGSGEYTVDIADVGGDGKSDLITLSGAGEVFVHAGQADGKFKATASAAAEALDPMMNGAGDFEPIAVADVSGDGRADLVGYRGSASSGKVVSFAGAENGTFGAQTTAIASIDDALTDAKGQYFLDVVDVSGDGRADLVTVDADSTLRIHKGQSGLTFAAATAGGVGVDPIMDDGEGHEPVGVADVTGDAKADLVTLYSDGKVFVFAGKGDGTFELPAGGGKSGEPSYTGLDSSLLDGAGSDFLGLIDYDGDERADIVALTPSGDVLSYRAAANSTFLAPASSPGAVFSARFEASPGHQPAGELPFYRRGGCGAAGCDWPLPTTTPRWTPSEIDPPEISRRRYEEVTCVSASFCYAVGDKLEGGVEKSQVRFWNGSSWAGQTVPAPAGATASELSGVSCASTTFCMAAGSYVESGTRKTLILSWNGTAWSVSSSPNVSGAISSELEAVSCASTTSCIAAGSYRDSGGVQKQLGMRLNAGAWAIGTSALPSGASSSEFSDTTCAGFCMAAGSYVDSTTGVRKTLVLKMVFGIWAQENAVNPPEATSSRLLAIECPLSSPCTAVGRYIDSDGVRKTLAISRPSTGGEWTVSSTPNPADSNSELTSVWCPTATECAALGTYTDESGTRPLLEAWDSTSGWMLGSMPAPESAVSARMSGVHCTSTNACVAVGTAKYGNGQPRDLAYEYSDSDWSIIHSDPPAPAAGKARAVACAPESDCVAILGMEAEGATTEIARKLGTGGWSSMPAFASAESPLFTDVSCTAANACTAVGVKGAANARTTLAQRWNGSAWSTQTTPNPENGTQIEIGGVFCPLGNYCVAVGSYTVAGTTKTLAMRWNGVAWAIQTTPNPAGATASRLEGVHCFNSSVCGAVGSYFDSSGVQRLLVARWNGTEWWLPGSVTGPSGATSSELNDVSCTSSSVCFAVGSYLDSAGTRRHFVEKLSSGIWTPETTPSFGGAPTELHDISCDASFVCVAAGIKTISGNEHPLTLKRSVSPVSWSAQAAAGPFGAERARLDSVSCKATGNCVAVGSFDNGSHDEPLGLKGG